eukprot:362942-Chlamydomonas_euryale.AAC.15
MIDARYRQLEAERRHSRIDADMADAMNKTMTRQMVMMRCVGVPESIRNKTSALTGREMCSKLPRCELQGWSGMGRLVPHCGVTACCHRRDVDALTALYDLEEWEKRAQPLRRFGAPLS